MTFEALVFFDKICYCFHTLKTKKGKLMKYYKIILNFLLFIGCIVHGSADIKNNDTKNTDTQDPITERPIVVVVCSYNNAEWSQNTLDSIFTQEYSNFRLIIVDDCSSDDNPLVIQQYIDDHDLANRVTFIRNTQRCRKLFNLYRVLYD